MFIEEMVLRCDIKIIYDFWGSVLISAPLLACQNTVNLFLFTINLNKINLNCALVTGLKYLIIFN